MNNTKLETWVNINGYEGLYQVSSNGQVKSLSRTVKEKGGKIKPLKERLLKPRKHREGYLMVALCRDGKTKQFSVHRLVALAFLPNPEDKDQVNHKNGIKYDSRLCNLEWCTQKENNRHAVDTGLLNNKGTTNSQSKLTRRDVILIRLLLKKGKTSQRQIAKQFGVTHNTIGYINRGKRYTESIYYPTLDNIKEIIFETEH